MKQRLPKNILDSWERYRHRDVVESLPSSDDLRRFLTTKVRGRREREYDDGGSQGAKLDKARQDNSNRLRPYDKNRDQARSYSNRDKSYQRNESSGGGRTACVTPGCKQTHPAWRCACRTSRNSASASVVQHLFEFRSSIVRMSADFSSLYEMPRINIHTWQSNVPQRIKRESTVNDN